ncbi:hypothetical protein DFH09DRAFT_1108442 [Mycena vulgaris]|nr:hypothetical protein DFH09DRAFT_1108442 [Mycena vulgaris]
MIYDDEYFSRPDSFDEVFDIVFILADRPDSAANFGVVDGVGGNIEDCFDLASTGIQHFSVPPPTQLSPASLYWFYPHLNDRNFRPSWHHFRRWGRWLCLRHLGISLKSPSNIALALDSGLLPLIVVVGARITAEDSDDTISTVIGELLNKILPRALEGQSRPSSKACDSLNLSGYPSCVTTPKTVSAQIGVLGTGRSADDYERQYSKIPKPCLPKSFLCALLTHDYIRLMPEICAEQVILMYGHPKEQVVTLFNYSEASGAQAQVVGSRTMETKPRSKKANTHPGRSTLQASPPKFLPAHRIPGIEEGEEVLYTLEWILRPLADTCGQF